MKKTMILWVLVSMVWGCKSSSPEPVEAQAPVEKAEPAPKKAEPVAGDFVAELREVAVEPQRTSPSGKARITHLAKGENAYLGRLVLEPKAKVPVHRDKTEEYLYFLEGGGVITIDGTSSEVKKGTAVFMPANAEVSFENGDEQSVVIQVFAGAEPSAKYSTWQIVGE